MPLRNQSARREKGPRPLLASAESLVAREQKGALGSRDHLRCARLIKRFIDSEAEFFFPAETLFEETRNIGAKRFDAKGADFGHVGMRCSFETMTDHSELWGKEPEQGHMARIINASDVLLKLYDFSIMEGFGIWALAQGYAESDPDDLDKLEYAVPMYEALY